MFRNSLESLPRRYDTLNKNRINEVFDVLELPILRLTLLALLICRVSGDHQRASVS
jgi:hypothetical protein